MASDFVIGGETYRCCPLDLRPISPTMRRVFVPQSERACICAFGKRLASATPKMIEEGNLNG